VAQKKKGAFGGGQWGGFSRGFLGRSRWGKRSIDGSNLDWRSHFGYARKLRVRYASSCHYASSGLEV